MILIAFLLVIVAGLGFFWVIFSKELKNGVLNSGGDSEALQKPGTVFQDSVLRNSDGLAEGTLHPGLSAAAEPDSGGILNERYSKLEQLLDEKNRSLEKVEKELLYERSHRAEFEKLKALLQNQIDELKLNNKKLKEELTEARRKGAERAAVQEPLRKPVISPVPLPKFDQVFDLKELAGPVMPSQDGNKNNDV